MYICLNIEVGIIMKNVILCIVLVSASCVAFAGALVHSSQSVRHALALSSQLA